MIRTALLGSAAMLAACQTVEPADGGGAAVLEPAAVDLAREELARGLNVGRVELGGGDPTAEPQIVVLPPRPTVLEGNSPAMPRVFSISIEGGACLLSETAGDLVVALPRSACRAL